jgi:hypothetical protein
MTEKQMKALKKGNKKRIYNALVRKVKNLKTYQDVMTFDERKNMNRIEVIMSYNQTYGQ